MELLSHGTPYIVVSVSYQDEHCVTVLQSANKLYNTLHANEENQMSCYI